jgi:Cytochrome c
MEFVWDYDPIGPYNGGREIGCPCAEVCVMTRWSILLFSLFLAVPLLVRSAEPTSGGDKPALAPSAERGKKALLEKAYNPATITLQAYQTVWKQWGLAEKPAPADYDRMLRERYGLHAAPYPNNGLPMGLRETSLPLGLGKGIGQDCLICHGGSIAGKSIIGLGNTALDYEAFHEEMTNADGRDGRPPFAFCNVRGTSEAGGMAVFLLGYREPDLSMRLTRLDLDLQDDLCGDPPAWWLLKKKKTMYHSGGGDARSVRSLMQFMMSPLNPPSAFSAAEADFADIRAYLLALEPPKYPLPIDQNLARKGEDLFKENCSRCHGTYGEKWTYPNKIVPLKEIGTDRRRYDGVTAKFGVYYNKSWFGQGKSKVTPEGIPALPTAGYQAPPLDGVWATAPYLHNGSVPTVYHLLNSKTRPRLFTRSYRTDLDAYDAAKLGWKVEELKETPARKQTPIEARKIYDTTKSGRGNGGHTFGDSLTDEERMAVIEYLKTL